MLPNSFSLNKTTEDRLKLLKLRTGVAPNVSARLAFFKSIHSGFKATNWGDYVIDGGLRLDKLTWLGSNQLVIETVLKSYYPRIESVTEMQRVWAMHVEHGSASFHNRYDLGDFVSEILK
ncbi:MAG: DNA sulfur modification protein DndE [Idiomarina sp.]|uniref:DndE family protein n=1 Tax=Idiomarina sp. TaxID=1874361 RepID=UPI000C411AC2|nr:DndE family protein [Idiomarina sp.]MBT41820.1 DNA sulfur modification protein DndE [Idiomarina sp.]